MNNKEREEMWHPATFQEIKETRREGETISWNPLEEESLYYKNLNG